VTHTETIAEIREWLSPKTRVDYPYSLRAFEKLYTKSHNYNQRMLEIVDEQSAEIERLTKEKSGCATG
jgi:hypothetical protein